MSSTARSRFLDRVFAVALVLKGLDGLLEIVGGALLLIVTPQQIGAFTRLLTLHELSEDPDDLVANTIVRWAKDLSVSASLFAALYLLLHGVIKVVLVWAVLRDRLWAFPLMIAFLLVFIAYQGYLMALNFTWLMLALTLFDAAIVWLTLREYRVRRARATVR